MFDGISPKLKNLLGLNNTWTGSNTYIKYNTSFTPTTSIIFSNQTPATSAIQFQSSPAMEWVGNGWKSGGTAASQLVKFRAYVRPTASSVLGSGEWKLEYSQNNAAYSTALQVATNVTDGLAVPLTTVTGIIKGSYSNSTTIDTLPSFELNNPSGTRVNVTHKYGSTIKYGLQSTDQGTAYYHAAGTSPIHNFHVGSSIGTTTLVAQIYGNGIYCGLNGYFGQRLTAGQADTSVQTTLSSYGSMAAKGTLITNSSYTLADTETFVYVDPSNTNVCTGTPTVVCSALVTEGTCNAESDVGCSWSAGTSCGGATGTDSGTCTGQGAGCTWEEVPCSSANNTDQTTCENQDDPYGGNCSWDTSTCSGLGADQGTCEGQSGCTWNFSDCHAFDGQSQGTCEGNTGCSWVGGDCAAFDNTDQATCETGHTGCVWDGMTLCAGTYDEGSSCSGQYDTSCSGNLCTGNYNTGNCTGNFGAGCQGTANCGLLITSGTCSAQSGCTWTAEVTVTLPTTANASRGTTGRFYSIMHVGETGNVNIVGQSGQPIFQYTTLPLFKKGDKVLLHNQNITFQCSVFTSSTPCSAQTGCTWNTAIVCGDFGSQEDCESAGCSWDGDTSTCSGPGSAANCSGTYSNGAHWYAHSLERGLNYVEKTANYTVTSIDDIINCTSGTFTLTLPDASLNNGKQFTLKNTGAGTITLNTTSSQTIDGNASGTLTLTAGQSKVVVSNNSNWIIVSQV